MLIIVFCTMLFTGVPLELVSLFLSFIQTIIAVLSLKEEFVLGNRFLVESGTHGVVQIFWEQAEAISSVV